MRAITSILPESVKKPLRDLRDFARAVPYYGKGRFCPVCGMTSRRFRSYGLVPRDGAECVHCGSLERHRFLWLYFSKRTDLFNGARKKMLHVAPEKCFEPRFRERLGSCYLTADLYNERAMVKMDITNIEYADRSFDVIYCSHVLEHVHDDKKALSEFYRVLKNSGWAILLVPITSKKTYEDPSITDPEERLRAFGQADHVRKYGPDYIDRLREAGFSVDTIRAADMLQRDEAEEMGISRQTCDIYFCKKRTEELRPSASDMPDKPA